MYWFVCLVVCVYVLQGFHTSGMLAQTWYCQYKSYVIQIYCNNKLSLHLRQLQYKRFNHFLLRLKLFWSLTRISNELCTCRIGSEFKTNSQIFMQGILKWIIRFEMWLWVWLKRSRNIILLFLQDNRVIIAFIYRLAFVKNHYLQWRKKEVYHFKKKLIV